MKVKTSKLGKIKHPSVKALKKKAWTEFSKFIRTRDCLLTTGTKTEGICISCGRRVEFSNCDAGHFISRSKTATLFHEKNVNLQCKSCNAFSDARVFDVYRINLIKKWGKGTDIEIEEKSLEIKKFTPYELQELIEVYKKKVEEL